MSDQDIKSLSAFVWSIAETLRGDFKQSEYGVRRQRLWDRCSSGLRESFCSS